MSIISKPTVRLWVGIDAGKGHHWVCVIDDRGQTVWSSKVTYDETAILDTVAAILQLGDQITWGSRHHRCHVGIVVGGSGRSQKYSSGVLLGRVRLRMIARPAHAALPQ